MDLAVPSLSVGRTPRAVAQVPGARSGKGLSSGEDGRALRKASH
jgi:hypothetical protein